MGEITHRTLTDWAASSFIKFSNSSNIIICKQYKLVDCLTDSDDNFKYYPNLHKAYTCWWKRWMIQLKIRYRPMITQVSELLKSADVSAQCTQVITLYSVQIMHTQHMDIEITCTAHTYPILRSSLHFFCFDKNIFGHNLIMKVKLKRLEVSRASYFYSVCWLLSVAYSRAKINYNTLQYLIFTLDVCVAGHESANQPSGPRRYTKLFSFVYVYCTRYIGTLCRMPLRFKPLSFLD